MEAGAGGSSRRTPPNPAMPYREDCWSEGETSALIDAWGDRYVELNRGNLRQQHWQEVADAVNSRRGAAASRRPSRTDIQCKNRIDTLKKKYKVEKARIIESGGAAESQWQFYPRLDALVGSTTPAAAPKTKPASTAAAVPTPPLAVPLPYHRNGASLPTAATATAAATAKDKRPRMVLPSNNRDPSFQKNYSALAAAAAAAAEKDSDSDSEPSSRSSRSSRETVNLKKRWREMKDDDEHDEQVKRGGDGMKELAHAIQSFAEIYQRVEEAKQKQMIELEKQRMEFAKSLEFERMQVFVDSQIQLQKIKRAKQKDADGY